MASLAPAFPSGPLRLRLSADAGVALGLLLAALLIRGTHFGDPAYQIDEQFYLVVGDRMLHGALPYVDIWDRKPIGLFLIYAAIRLLGGEGVYQYQAVACLFAAATAWIIHRIALPRAGRFGAVAAGLLYLLWIETIEGGGGQAPIFYNPLMAGAAWCVLAAGGAEDPRAFRRHGQLAMLLAGLAIQIKYTALFEGLYLGLVLAWWTWRRTPAALPAAAHIMRLAAIALAPTIAVAAFYAAIGAFDPFWFANFRSIFLRVPSVAEPVNHRLFDDIKNIAVLAFCFAASFWSLRREPTEEGRRWIAVIGGWTVFAVIGFLSIGMYYCHYLLPLYVPLAIGAAPLFRLGIVGRVAACVAMWLPFAHLDYPDFTTTANSRRQFEAIVALIPADVDRGCMQLLAGPPLLYKVTNACFVSPYIFPEHLLGVRETHAIGVDQAAALSRALARHPRVIVTNDSDHGNNPQAAALLYTTLRRSYRHAGRVVLNEWPNDVWVSRTPPER